MSISDNVVSDSMPAESDVCAGKSSSEGDCQKQDHVSTITRNFGI